MPLSISPLSGFSGWGGGVGASSQARFFRVVWGAATHGGRRSFCGSECVLCRGSQGTASGESCVCTRWRDRASAHLNGSPQVGTCLILAHRHLLARECMNVVALVCVLEFVGTFTWVVRMQLAYFAMSFRMACMLVACLRRTAKRRARQHIRCQKVDGSTAAPRNRSGKGRSRPCASDRKGVCSHIQNLIESSGRQDETVRGSERAIESVQALVHRRRVVVSRKRRDFL